MCKRNRKDFPTDEGVIIMDFGKITFSRKYDDGEYITHSVSGESSLPDVVEAFTYFLKGCGYQIPNGEALDFVPEDGYSSEGWDSMETVTDDFDPRGGMGDIGIDSATPEEWNKAYQNVTMTYNGKPIVTK